MPRLPFRAMRRFLDPVVVVLGWGCWVGAVLMTIFPPTHAWRGQALFACVFAPVGCLLRYYMSLHLNPIHPAFPLGTFTVNIFGTVVLGTAYDLQRVPLLASNIPGGSVAGCQVLQGVMDGFCGCLTTVSTWISELDSLKRRHAYVYGAVSVLAGLALLVIVMGSVLWTTGWVAIVCTV
ncbi:MAG: CrcB family protein [Cytophagaceae bacterium]|nr:MAG: CrcB family protein [Cytophagaceae bacterium]